MLWNLLAMNHFQFMVIHKSNDLLFMFLLDENLVQFWLSQTSLQPFA
jgi:hypothetical protein